MIRLMSNFSYKDGDGKLTQVPVMYGDITRQVGHILRDNSENKIPSAPRIGVYITGLELDRDRLADASFVGKVHLRERDYDETNNEYLNTQGKNVTVERLMPTPYKLTVSADIWSTNTEQKLQIMEQILMLFNPSLEIQTTNNYVDWTSLSLIELQNVNYSTRSIPQGVDTEIDIGELSFIMPIWITPPAKVKKLGVIEKIIMSVFDESGSVSDGIIDATIPEAITVKSPGDYKLLVLNNTARLLHAHEGINESRTGQFTRTGTAISWLKLLDMYPGKFTAGVSSIRLTKSDGNEVVATASLNPTDDTQMVLSIDSDTVPENTLLTDPVNTRGTIDAIIDPTTFNPNSNSLNAGTRYLILNPINPDLKGDSADANPNAWQNADGSLFKADANDIIVWTGTEWKIVLDVSGTNDGTDSASSPSPVYITNTYTGIQYKLENGAWLKSFEGEYEAEKWRLVL